MTVQGAQAQSLGYEFWRLAEMWEGQARLPKQVLFDEFLAAFWRGEFEVGGASDIVFTAGRGGREWTSGIRAVDGDYSHTGQPVTRRLMLETLAGRAALPECGIGEAFRGHEDRTMIINMMLSAGGSEPAIIKAIGERLGGSPPLPDELREEAFKKIARAQWEGFDPVAQDLLRSLAIDGAALVRWFCRRSQPAPLFVQELAGTQPTTATDLPAPGNDLRLFHDVQVDAAALKAWRATKVEATPNHPAVQVAGDAGLAPTASDETKLAAPATDLTASLDSNKSPKIHTGCPGRPTARHLFEAELRRRAEAGKKCSTIGAEAAALREWLINVHPDIATPTARSIENSIRPEFRRANEIA